MSYGNYPDLLKIRRVLIVKLRHLGDVLLTTAVFSCLKEAHPHLQIDAYVYEEAREILENNPNISSLITYDRKWKKLSFFKRLKKELQLLLFIRRQKYDLVLNLTEGDRGALIAKISGAKVRVGFPPKGKLQKKWITHTVKHCPSLRHTVEKNLDGLRRMGVFPSPESRNLFFHIEKEILDKMQALVGVDPFILIHPTSRWRFKCLPVKTMQSVVSKLESLGKKVVITSGPDPIEIAMVEEIAIGTKAQILAGKTSLKELGALIVLSEKLICVDSVAHHMASALKQPVLVFFGPTSQVTWGPWKNPHAKVFSQNFSCQPCYQDGCGGSKQSDCLATISAEKILKMLELNPINSSVKNRLGL